MTVKGRPLQDHPGRKLPRHETEAVKCDLGLVLDLSGSGVRLLLKKPGAVRLGQPIPVKLKTPHGMLPVTLRPVWKKRIGLWGGVEAGFAFVGIKPAQSVALATIARFGFVSAADVQPASNRSDPRRTRSSPGNVEAKIVMAEYYTRLELSEDAGLAELKDAYRKMARKYHPDVAAGEENRQKFLQLREAYDLLSDHLKRAG